MHFGSHGKIFEHRSPEVKIGVWRTQIEEDQDPDGPAAEAAAPYPRVRPSSDFVKL